MPLLWIAALVGVILAHGTLHAVSLIVFLVLTIPTLLVVLAAAGIIGASWRRI